MNNRLSRKNKAMILMCALAYIVFGVLIAKYIGISLDFQHDLIENIFGISALFSILVFIIFIWGYSNFDGSKDTWWSDILYDFFPYKDKRPQGKLFRDMIFPSLFISLWCFGIGPFVLICIIGLVCLVSYLLLLNPIIFAYSEENNSFYVSLALFFLELVLLLWHRYELHRNRIRYDYLAFVRTCYCIGLYAFGYVLIFMGYEESCKDLGAFAHSVRTNDIKLVDLAILLKFFINLLPGTLILYHCRRVHNVLIYAEDTYFLYLRSFMFDVKEDSLLKFFPKEKQIMKIGNPHNSLFLSGKTIYNDVLYLPTTNWKKHLDFYIYKAYSIISVVDNTKGVVWEMFHHSRYYNKILFYVDNAEILNKLEIDLRQSEEYKQSPALYQSIVYLNDLHVETPFVFWIKDSMCYYDTDLKKIASLLSSRLNVISEASFEIITEDSPEIEMRVETDLYDKWSGTARTMLLAKKCASFINAKIPLALFMIGMLVAVIFNVIFLGMIVWFGVEELLEGEIFAGTLTSLIGAGFLGGLTYGIYSIVKSN